MSYPKPLIITILRAFIKTEAIKSNSSLQVIPYQNLDARVLEAAIKNKDKGKICYLLESEDTVYHALIIAFENNRAECHYIYIQKPILSKDEILAYFKFSDIQASFSDNNSRKLNIANLQGSNQSVVFTEALCQLMIQPNITSINIKNSIIKHYKICQEATTLQMDKDEIPQLKQSTQALYKIFQQLALLQLNKLNDKYPQASQVYRLLCLYNLLIKFLQKPSLTLLAYTQQKTNFYKIKTVTAADCVQLLDAEFVFAILNIDELPILWDYLNQKCNDYLQALLQAEKTKFSTKTLQKLSEITQVSYNFSQAFLCGELAVQLPDLIQCLLADNPVLITDRTITNKIKIAHILKAIGIIAGSYIQISSTPYELIKSVSSYYASQNLAKYLQSERFNDKTCEVIPAYLKYSFKDDSWYLLVLILFLLVEACLFKDYRQFVYIGAALFINLFLTRWLVSDKSKNNVDSHIPTRIFLFLLSRFLSNVVVGYMYHVVDSQTACSKASKQFTDAIEGQALAIDTSCSSRWMPDFFGGAQKLNVFATNKKGHTYEYECDINLSGLSSCTQQNEYNNLLKMT